LYYKSCASYFIYLYISKARANYFPTVLPTTKPHKVLYVLLRAGKNWSKWLPTVPPTAKYAQKFCPALFPSTKLVPSTFQNYCLLQTFNKIFSNATPYCKRLHKVIPNTLSYYSFHFRPGGPPFRKLTDIFDNLTLGPSLRVPRWKSSIFTK
jgi:hypothetical protein